MKSARAYRSLLPEEKDFLSATAQEVAMLVAEAKAMGCFRERLSAYTAKWRAFQDVLKAERAGKWQPSMGTQETIWLQTGPGLFVLEPYLLLAIIHDNVLPNCPSVGKGILPVELADKMWSDLVTGADNEDTAPRDPDATYRPRWRISRAKIESNLRDVKADIANWQPDPDYMTYLDRFGRAAGSDAKALPPLAQMDEVTADTQTVSEVVGALNDGSPEVSGGKNAVVGSTVIINNNQGQLAFSAFGNASAQKQSVSDKNRNHIEGSWNVVMKHILSWFGILIASLGVLLAGYLGFPTNGGRAEGVQ